MSAPDDLPPELRHLIEKRDQEDRRSEARRAGDDRRQPELPPADDADQTGQRSGRERRASERRKRKRRK